MVTLEASLVVDDLIRYHFLHLVHSLLAHTAQVVTSRWLSTTRVHHDDWHTQHQSMAVNNKGTSSRLAHPAPVSGCQQQGYTITTGTPSTSRWLQIRRKTTIHFVFCWIHFLNPQHFQHFNVVTYRCLYTKSSNVKAKIMTPFTC